MVDSYGKSFYEKIQEEINLYSQVRKSANKKTIKIDLHCHDRNSREPDEIIGRIIKVPETWIKPKKCIELLKTKGFEYFTITNHNNTDSCYQLLEEGIDVIIGCEFSCYVPDFKVDIHVLGYGFNKEQEKRLFSLRNDIYEFQKYAFNNQIPTIWAHPLYNKHHGRISLDFYEKMSLVFERYEVLNGQRDTWQNLLIKKWLDILNQDKINLYAKKYKIDLNEYSNNPYIKGYYGGSDSHMGIFIGDTGTNLEITESIINSNAILKAMLNNQSFPFGDCINSDEKMWIAFIDYFCQIGINIEDPGLFRILFHKGTMKEKMIGLTAVNLFFELRKHKITKNFLKTFHQCFQGKKPYIGKKLFVKKDYKEVFNQAIKIASHVKENNKDKMKNMTENLINLNNHLLKIIIERLEKRFNNYNYQNNLNFNKINDIIDKAEISSIITYLFADEKKNNKYRISSFSFKNFLDDLSFPSLAYIVILIARFISSKVLYQSRDFLNEFSENINYLNHPKKILWITDTFFDKNGVSTALQTFHRYVKGNNLSIDFCVCHETELSTDHLIVIKPIKKIIFPFYENQPLRIPNILEIYQLFKENSYDKVICSTEGIMGFISIFIKNAFTVPIYFYLHTDWLTFIDNKFNVNKENMSRLRRILRAFYHQFDKIFVLNNDDYLFLQDTSMEINKNKIYKTKHWVENYFFKKNNNKNTLFQVKDKFIILYVGRISEEKGINDIIKINKILESKMNNFLFAIIGSGPKLKEMKEMLPKGLFLEWIEHNKLSNYYSAADILILPSKFDTFACVVLEALSCGCPAVCYNTKGPKDIIIHNKTGFLVNNYLEMANSIIYYKNNLSLQKEMKFNSIERAKDYNPDYIVNNFLKNIYE